MLPLWRGGVPIIRGGTRVSNLMFADDIVLFGEASKDQVEVIVGCLCEFYDLSG